MNVIVKKINKPTGIYTRVRSGEEGEYYSLWTKREYICIIKKKVDFQLKGWFIGV